MKYDELSYNVTVRLVSSVSVVVNIPYCLFTLTIVETGKNAVEAIKGSILEVVRTHVCGNTSALD